MANAANKDEALRCLEIAQRALKGNDRTKAERFLAKARRLCDCAEVSAFLSELGAQTSTDTSEELSTSKGPSKETETGAGVRQRNGRTANPSERPLSGSSSSGNVATKEQKAVVEKILENDNYYTILGIAQDADEEEIKRAYKKLALKLHPDKNSAPKAEEAFKAVSRAFSCLSNPEKRANYDQFGYEDRAQAAAAHGGHGMHDFYADDLDPNELFNMFFGGGYPSQHSPIFRTQFRAGGRRPQGSGVDGNMNFTGLLHILPLIVLFAYTFFSGPSEPPYKMSKDSPFTVVMNTKRFSVPYYVKSESQFEKAYPEGGYYRAQMELQIEGLYRDWLERNCREERLRQRRIRNWRGEEEAKKIELTHCVMLNKQFSSAPYIY